YTSTKEGLGTFTPDVLGYEIHRLQPHRRASAEAELYPTPVPVHPHQLRQDQVPPLAVDELIAMAADNLAVSRGSLPARTFHKGKRTIQIDRHAGVNARGHAAEALSVSGPSAVRVGVQGHWQDERQGAVRIRMPHLRPHRVEVGRELLA